MSIFPYINTFLLHEKSSSSTDRLSHFICSIIKRDEMFTAMFDTFVRNMTTLCSSNNKTVRQRSCELLGTLIDSLDEEVEIDEDVFMEIAEKVSPRLMDRFPQVRAAAIKAVYRLQDPERESAQEAQEGALKDAGEGECEIISALSSLLCNDENVSVRLEALKKIALTRGTLPLIVSRTRDRSASVRRAAFALIGKKVGFRTLSISNRVFLLQQGLLDRDPAVVAACLSLCRKWIDEHDGDLVQLVRGLNLRAYRAELKQIISVILREAPETYMVDAGALEMDSRGEVAPGSEAIFVYLSALREMPEEELRRTVALKYLSAEKLCAVLNSGDFLERVSVDSETLADLTEVACVYQFYQALRDEGGVLREAVERNLQNERHDITGSGVIGSLAKLYRALLPSDDQFVGSMSQMASELFVKYSKGSETGSHAADAEMSKSIVASCRIHSIKMIASVVSVLSCSASPPLGVSALDKEAVTVAQNAVLLELLNRFVVPSVADENPFVRNAAIECLGCFCVADGALAAGHLPLLVNVLRNDQDALQLTAMKAVFDVLLVHGDLLGEAKSDEAVDVLTEYLCSENIVLMNIAAEGFCKLFVNGAISDGSALSTCLLLFFNPATNENKYLRQVLSTFFSLFVSAALQEETLSRRKVLLRNAVAPCIKVVTESPPESPLQKVDMRQFLNFCLVLLSSEAPGKGAGSEVHVHHKSILLDVVYHVMAFPNNVASGEKLVGVVCSMKPEMLFGSSNDSEREEMKETFEKLLETMQEKGYKRKCCSSVVGIIERFRGEEKVVE